MPGSGRLCSNLWYSKSGSARRMLDGREESNILKHAVSKSMILEAPPELLWPPSLMSGGELLPLFEGSRCIFAADMNSSVDNSLYVHTNADTSDRIRTVPLRKVDGGNSGFAILKNTAKISFVTTRNWVFSSAILLHPSDLMIDDWLHELQPQTRNLLGQRMLGS